jgi:hypothetical protein
MNKERRARLLKALDMIADAQAILEECKSEEEDYRDNMPENLQASQKYETADQAVNELDSAIDSLNDVMSNTNTAME